MDTLQQQLEALRAARATGHRRVEYGERRVEFKTDAEMAAAIADLERRIATLQGDRITTVRIASSKGL